MILIQYEQLKKKERIFKGFTGVTVEEFEELESKAEPYWIEQEQERLSRLDRQRAEGGGRQKMLAFREQLLMTVIWLRLYLIQEALGYLFGVDKSSVSRYVNSVLPALRKVGEDTLGWSTPPKRGQGRSFEKVWSENPDLYAYVDATEQRIRRSGKQEQQKKDYSGKKNAHTRKTQLVVNEHGEVRDVSHSTEGSMHDRKHFTHSGVADKIPEKTVVGGDSGYQGIQNDLPDHKYPSISKQVSSTAKKALKNTEKHLLGYLASLHRSKSPKNGHLLMRRKYSTKNFLRDVSSSKTPFASSNISAHYLSNSDIKPASMIMFSEPFWQLLTRAFRNVF